VIRAAVLGPSGRMGRRVIELLAARTDMMLGAAIDHPSSPLIGQTVAGAEVASGLSGLAGCQVYIDFTSPEATEEAARAAAQHRVAAVVGTTGLGPAAEDALDDLARVAPVLVAANFSLGVNLLLVLAETAARALGTGFDLEIVEAHHRDKRDAPSGTALALARALSAGRGVELETVLTTARSGDVGARPDGEIGVVAVRGGDVIGDHTAFFLGDGERIELTHRASSRDLFAAGALRAAAWIAGRPRGRYTMRDVLGL
jgi:4-hydroxy-tetrahydrodipicolinate reductase